MYPVKNQLHFKKPKFWAKKPEFYCEACGNSQYITKEINGKSYVQPCTCRIGYLKYCYFGKEFVDKTIENYEPRNESMHIAREYTLKNLHKSLFFYGPVNNGKTHLMAGIFDALMRKGINNIKVFDDAKLRYALQPASVGQFNWREDVNKVINDIIGDAQVIMLEDVGKPEANLDVGCLFRFYDRLYSQKKHVFISSNYSREKLAGIYTVAIASRIERMCDDVEIKDQGQLF